MNQRAAAIAWGVWCGAMLAAGVAAQDSRADLPAQLAALHGLDAAVGFAASIADPGRALPILRLWAASHPAATEAWFALAAVADRVGDYALGVDAGAKALVLLQHDAAWPAAARAAQALANRHLRFGRSEARRAALRQVLALREKAGLDRIETEEELRRLELESTGEADADPARLRTRATEARLAGDPGIEHTALVNLAYTLYRRGDFRDGLAAYRRVLELHASLELPSWQRANDRNGAARLALELALTVDGPERTSLLGEARLSADAALAMHEREAAGAALVWDHCVLAHIREAAGDDLGAEVEYAAEEHLVLAQRRTAAGEDERALRLFDAERFHTFEDHALHLVKSKNEGSVRVALAASERGRTSAWQDLLSLRGITEPGWMKADAPLEPIQRGLATCQGILLVYLRGSHQTAVIAVAPQSITVHPLGSPRAMDGVARRFTAAVLSIATPPAEVERAGREAFDTFLAPALGGRVPPARIIVVGSAALGDVPLGAMVRPGPEPVAERFVAATSDVAHAPLLGVLCLPGAAATGPALGVGFDGRAAYAPDLARHFGATGLTPLRNAEAEARSIATLLGGRALAGPSATEEAFRDAAANATFIHVAAHALADPRDGMRAALLLAPNPGLSDGFLSLGELLEIRMAPRLVMLAGCRTSAGRVYEGEGVRGLARAMLAAGARNVVASIAPVDDENTPEFSRAVFTAIKSGQSVARAFGRAQARLIARQRTSHPALWAAFVLHGQNELLAP